MHIAIPSSITVHLVLRGFLIIVNISMLSNEGTLWLILPL
jgi:hypothetical protein